MNCFKKVRQAGHDLFGRAAVVWKVIRTSNAYTFRDPLPCHKGREIVADTSKSENPTGTLNQDISSTYERVKIVVLDPKNALDAALIRLGRTAGHLPMK